MRTLRRAVANQHGFSMITVMIAMTITGLFVTGAFAAADGDLPILKRSENSKKAYAAAEAGVNFYAFHLAQDDRYWSKCANVPAPNASEPSPVVQKWYGAPDPDPRNGHWRKVQGSNADYAIELIPATAPTASNPKPQCVQGDDSSMLDPSTGMIRIRVTGRSGSSTRTLIVSFRRKGLLDFIWLTNYETQDPNAYESDSRRDWAAANCVDYRAGPDTSCTNQQFAADDEIFGPLHSNDTLWTCNGSTFGRPGRRDRLEVSGPAPGWQNRCGTTAPNFNSTFYAAQPMIDIPESNSSLKSIAQSGGRVLTGKHYIRLNGGQMQIDNGAWESQPDNGVLYVQTGAGGCTTKPPILADYAESSSCGNAYVSGTYSANLTIAADNDVIISQPPRPTPTSPAWPDGSEDLRRQTGSSAVLGLIAENFVRISHHVSRLLDPNDFNTCTNINSTDWPNHGDVYVDAAILSVKHSFTVDNWGCGAQEGDLHIKGAIAQNFRGTVGYTGSTGYYKDYVYDDLLKLRTPPYFLSPLATPWLMARMNEQVPAT
jgi:hypothetical protein